MREFIEEPVGICIHHSLTKDSSSCSATAIRRVQMEDMGFDEIAYTMIVEDVAETIRVFTGRPSFMQGAHEPKLNRSHLSICVVGNYDLITPSDLIIKGTIRACLALMLMNPQITAKNVVFHSDYSEKSCPGKLFPRDGFIKRLEAAYWSTIGKANVTNR